MQYPLAVYTDVDDIDPEPGARLLREAGFTVARADSRDPDVIADVATGAIALLAGYAPVDAALLDRLSDLRIVSLLSNGSDNVDIDAATERGIWVCAVGDAASEEVAVHAWTLSLAMIRRLDFFLRVGPVAGWLDRPDDAPRRLSDLTVGVLGLGTIGSRFARLATSGAGRVIALDRRGDREPIPGVTTVETLDELLSVSDVLGVFLPLSDSTRGLLDAAALARMPHGAHLVNVSRGPIVDTAALVEALDTGRLAGAAVDVFDAEPPGPDDPLVRHPKVIATPHVGYLSDATVTAYVERQARSVLTWYADGVPERAINTPKVKA
ncbi:C-terminal binding protein [Millisia brevis]|uniref:C-terminal binding protein n=1 Tax=Millisia brevis TaxID=264148 RepID=UPI00082DA37A|nr:C-terminal binding protein [Millisia brevis]